MSLQFRKTFSRSLRLESLEPRQMLAADVELLKDMNPAMLARGYVPQQLAEMNGLVYYSANDGATGYELWRSDGTAEGTYLLKDILPGSSSSAPQALTNVDGVLYFYATDGQHGSELWKSDGTEAGTVLVTDVAFSNDDGLFANQAGISPQFTKVGDSIYFLSRTLEHNVEIWRTDDTAAGASIVTELNSGSGYYSINSLVNFNGVLHFTHENMYGRSPLWKTDGTPAGTALVDSASPITANATSVLTPFDDALFFRGLGPAGYELYKLDGSTGLLELAVDLAPPMAINRMSGLGVLNDSLYFSSDAPGVAGLWRWDAGAAAPERIREIASGEIANLTIVGDQLYYAHAGGVWKSDGTLGGDQLVAAPDGLAFNFVAAGSQLFFFVSATNRSELWSTAGAVESASMLFAASSTTTFATSSPLLSIGAHALFVNQRDLTGVELWRSDGSVAGTVVVRDRLAGISGNPNDFVRIGDSVLFSGYSGLWKTDGTPEGTQQLKFLQLATQMPMRLSDGYSAAMNGILYFVALDVGKTRYQLWRSDGTSEGTYAVKTINPTGDAFLPYAHPSSQGDTSPYLTVVGDTLYFRATDGVNGLELWRSDGTAAGTFMLTNVNTTSTKSAFYGASQHFAPAFTAVDGELYFRATNGVTGQGVGLWKTDGTIAGTTRLGLAPNNSAYSPEAIAAIGDDVYFMGNLGAAGYGVWKYESANGAVTLIKSVMAQGSQLAPIQFRVAGGFLYFTSAVLSSARHELWRTDGTSEGLVKLFSVPSEIYADQGFTQFATVGDELYFLRTVYGALGVQLWRSGGDPENTLLVHDSVGSANLKSSSAGPLYFVRHGAVTSPSLAGLYVSDGTAEGTTLVANRSAEYGYVFPTEFVTLDNQVIFNAYVERFGSELWVADLPPVPAILGDFDRNGQVDGADFLRWQRTFGASVNYSGAGADADANRRIDGDDLAAWATNLGAAIPPEAVAAEEQLLVAATWHLAALPVTAPLVETTRPANTPASIATPLAWFLLPGDVELPRDEDRALSREEHLNLAAERRLSPESPGHPSLRRQRNCAPADGEPNPASHAASRSAAPEPLDAIWDEALARLY